MADFKIMRNGLNTEIVGDPHIGQSSEDVTVTVTDDGTYSGYTKKLYYSYCYHNEVHRALSALNSNDEFIIPVQAFFEPGMVKLTVELSNGTNKPACNACFLVVTNGAKDVDASVLPSEKTWQSYIQSYLKSDIVHKPTVDALEKRIDNLILSSGSDSSAEVIDARNGYDGTTYDTLGTAIRKQVSELKGASNVGDRLFAIESALNVNSVFKTTVGDRLFAIESALNKLITSEFSTKQYDYILDEKLEPILDEIGDSIIANGTDLVLSGPALSGVKDYLFNPETENRWNVWGWSGETVVIPILYIYGYIPGSKGEGKFKINYRFKDINGQDLVGVGKIGVQGQSSSGLPKKNYSITFADKFLAKNDWLPSKKYTFKSCWNDPTWARNAVSGRLWAQCVASRPNVSYEPILDEKKDSLLDQNGDAITVPSYPIDVYPNHGTYDGFPIYIIANGKYIGLYTMLIAKDKDMFGIGQYKQYKKTECVVSNEGAYSSSAGGFKQANLVVDAEEGEDVSGKSTAWTYECIPNEKPKPSDYDKGVDDDDYKEDLSKYEADNTKFRASLNTMIQSVVDSTGTDDKDTNYKKVSAQYLDYDSVVDYMIFSSLINAADDVGKNWLLVTYDGAKWFFSAYDLDTTWGNWCPDYNNPNLLWRPDEGSPSLKDWNGYNRAMHMIWTYDPQRLIDRYEYLRSTVFSEENVYREFLSFIRKIPINAIEADRRLFRTEPNGMDFAQLENWYRLRVKKMDKQIEDLKASIATA